MSGRFTQGPWIVDRENPCIIRDQDDTRIADCDNFQYTDDGEIQLPDCPHNARLIAAAPDLYEALIDFIENPLFQVAVGGNPVVVDRMLDRARAALAKARGEQP